MLLADHLVGRFELRRDTDQDLHCVKAAFGGAERSRVHGEDLLGAEGSCVLAALRRAS
ncbi:hypothetical protein AB0L74_26955 [Streptomyces sp. NPDC052020]|uniref:hypothetical protein n=1 Tax=Streptomyces sp. NPDC052020 TaxID=3155677 RepID=UPI00342A745C